MKVVPFNGHRVTRSKGRSRSTMAPRPPAGGGPDPRTIYLQTEATIERLRKLVPVIDQHIAELRRSGIELGPTRRGRER